MNENPPQNLNQNENNNANAQNNQNPYVIIKQSTNKSFNEIVYSMLLTKNVHPISFCLLFLIMTWLIYFYTFFDKEDFSIFQLESEKRRIDVLCWLINTAVVILLWNVYAFIYLTVYKYDYTKGTEGIISTLSENFYKNPFSFTLVLYNLDSDIFGNSIDNSFWFLIIWHYYFITLHVIQFFKKFDIEIASINKFDSEVSRKLLSKMKCVSLFFFIINMIFTFIVNILLSNTNRQFKFMYLCKGIYIAHKICELYFTRKNEFLFLQYDNTTKEKKFLSNLKTKATLELITMALIYIHIILSYTDDHSFLFLLVLFFFFVYHLYKIIVYYRNYISMRDCFKNLDLTLSDKIVNNDDECVICTEKLNEARKLSCNHCFHLICLGKWFWKGYKTCPICRKVIQIDENKIRIYNENANRVSISDFRLNGNFFWGWIPNIRMRIIRFTNGGNNQQQQQPQNAN